MTVEELDAAIAKISARLSAQDAALKAKVSVFSAARIKFIISSVVMIIAVFSMAMSTLAYFTANVSSGNNVISTGSSNVEFVDLNSSVPGRPSGTELDPIRFMPGYKEQRKIYAVNKGGMPVYLRAKAETLITLDSAYSYYQEQVDDSLILFHYDSLNWTFKDGYYYYNTALVSGRTSSELFESIEFSSAMGNYYKDASVRITVTFQTVQANNNGDTVFDAVGWAADGEGGTP